MQNYRWTAGNNGSFLNGYRYANTRLGAVRAARAYIEGELFGDGKARIETREEGTAETWWCFETHEKSIFTGFKWRKQS